METVYGFRNLHGPRFSDLNHGDSGAFNKSRAKFGSRHSRVSFLKRPVTEGKPTPFEGLKHLFAVTAMQLKGMPKTPFDDSPYPQIFREGDEPSFWNRLMLAWRVLFSPRKRVLSSSDIAKRRLKMILISDRCAVNDEAKRKIVNGIVDVISDYVEIQSEENVQVNVSADPDLGTVYSVSVPVRRVKPQYQEFGSDLSATDGDYGGNLLVKQLGDERGEIRIPE